jgi:hypothetical protein
VSSAILYLAIVAIWAFLLVPRWIRRGHSASVTGGSAGSEGSGSESASATAAGSTGGPMASDRAGGRDAEPAEDFDADDADTAPMPAVVVPPGAPVPAGAPAGSGASARPGAPGAGGPEGDADGSAGSSRLSGSTRPVISRGKALQARRRLLTVLVLLGVAAASCTALRLASPWVCIPPAVMLATYVLLLRETALADSERAGRRAARDAAERREALAKSRAAWAARTPQPVMASGSAQIIDISARLRDQLYDQYEDAAARAVGD